MLMTLGEFLRDVFIVFMFVLWFWLLITVIGDLFRRHDISGFGKVVWIIVLLLMPYIGIFAYLLTQGSGMAERQRERVEKARAELVGAAGLSPADELTKLEALKAKGSISDAEFGKLRARVIG